VLLINPGESEEIVDKNVLNAAAIPPVFNPATVDCRVAELTYEEEPRPCIEEVRE